MSLLFITAISIPVFSGSGRDDVGSSAVTTLVALAFLVVFIGLLSAVAISRGWHWMDRVPRCPRCTMHYYLRAKYCMGCGNALRTR